MTKKNYPSLDFAKWFCSLLIIIIHTDPFSAYSKLLSFYTKDVFARIAVPLFFTISGFLFFRKLAFSGGKIEQNRDNVMRLFRYVRSLVTVYILTSLFYLLYRIPYWYSIDWWGFHVLKDYIVSFFLSGSEYHLWYLLASIYGIILLYVILSFVDIKNVKYLCIAGWIIECLLYSYSWIGIENIEILSWFTSRFPVCFDAAFRAIPLMAVGLFCAVKPSSENRPHIWLRNTIISFTVLVTEASLLHFLTPNPGKYSYILLTPVFAYCALNWLLSLNVKVKHPYICPLLRKSSLIIYCIHPMIIYCMDALNVTTPVVKWLLVTLLSVIIAFVAAHLLIIYQRKHTKSAS